MNNVTTINPRVFFNKQCDKNDIVFNGYTARGIRNDSILDDVHYGRQDHEMYCFSTMGKGLHAMYPNNMATPIRDKPNLNGQHMTNILWSKLDKTSSRNGVYIIEYYTIHNDQSGGITPLIDYYLNTTKLINNLDIQKELNDALATRKGKLVPLDMKLRIITFVEEADILKHTNIYVPGANIVVCKGNLNMVSHPTSNYASDAVSTVDKADSNNVIYIDIIDNENHSPYFIKIGNDVHKILSVKDSSKQDGCFMVIKKNGAYSADTISCGLDNLQEIGIHTSYNDALSDGNVAKLTEIKKIELEHNKIQLEYKKLEHEMEKMKREMEHLREKHAMEIEKKSLELLLMEEKALLDALILTSKFVLDTTQARIKHSYDMNKARVDGYTKLLTTSAVLFKLL
jgi:hypothetical protein